MQFLVPEAKIVEYLLKNTTKSGFFLPLGYSVADWTALRDDLLNLAANFPSTLRRRTPYGDEYEIIGEVQAPDGRLIKLRTSWMIRNDEADMMAFVTAYPTKAA